MLVHYRPPEEAGPDTEAWFRDKLVPLYADNGLEIRRLIAHSDNWLLNLVCPVTWRTFIEVTLSPEGGTWLTTALLERWHAQISCKIEQQSDSGRVEIDLPFCVDGLSIAWYDSQLLPYLRSQGFEASIEYTPVHRWFRIPSRRLIAKVCAWVPERTA